MNSVECAPIWAVVTARMGSARRPGKALAPVGTQPALAHVVKRLECVPELDGVIVATTDTPVDDPIRDWCGDAEVPCHSGSADDVLARTLEAATVVGARTIVRVTGDCPLVDPEVVRETIGAYVEQRPDYASNRLHGFTYPDGYDVEVFSTALLTDVESSAREQYDREHVTPYIYRHPDRFRLLGVEAPDALRRPELHLSLDHEEDLAVIRAIYEGLSPDELFGVGDVLRFLDARPDLVELSAGVSR